MRHSPALPPTAGDVHSPSDRGIHPRAGVVFTAPCGSIADARRPCGTDPVTLSPEIHEIRPGLMRPFRVLFLQRRGNAAQMPVRPLLDLLRSQGHISGYAVVDGDMSIGGDIAEHYDTVLAHRIPSSPPTRLAAADVTAICLRYRRPVAAGRRREIARLVGDRCPIGSLVPGERTVHHRAVAAPPGNA
jgi:hypothetical protein